MEPIRLKRPEEHTPPLSPRSVKKQRTSFSMHDSRHEHDTVNRSQHSIQEHESKTKNPRNLTIWTSEKHAAPQIMSAPIEGPTRTLPLPHNNRHARQPSGGSAHVYHPYSTPPKGMPTTPLRNQHPSRSPPHSAHPMSSQHPPFFSMMPKSQFLGIFDHLYDANNLVGTLKDQVRRSTSLLQTLQASGQMIEGLVRNQVREMQNEFAAKFGTALTDVNTRLKAIEEKLGVTKPENEQDKSLFSANGSFHGFEGPLPDSSALQQILNRLETLESRVPPTIQVTPSSATA